MTFLRFTAALATVRKVGGACCKRRDLTTVRKVGGAYCKRCGLLQPDNFTINDAGNLA